MGIFFILCLSAFLLFDGASDLLSGEVTMLSMLEVMLGLTGVFILLSALQRLRKLAAAGPTTYRVITVTECKKCGFKDLRHFKREDYILKKSGKCPKCSKSLYISSIYLEPKEEFKAL
jgi:predicted Zn-ribbon and HTH transcriptional regulator